MHRGSLFLYNMFCEIKMRKGVQGKISDKNGEQENGKSEELVEARNRVYRPG